MESNKTIPVGFKSAVITLTGTSGTANVTGIAGLTKLATFDTTLTTTADNFVTSHAAAYLALGVTVTAASGILTFTNTTSDSGFGAAMITNATGDLSGTVVITSNKIYVGGSSRTGILLRRANHTAGSSAFAVKASLDPAETVTPVMTAFNLLVDNLTDSNATELTRINAKTLSSNVDALLQVDPKAFINWIELTITETTDGTASAYVLCEY